jgi:hypothetical protein
MKDATGTLQGGVKASERDSGKMLTAWYPVLALTAISAAVRRGTFALAMAAFPRVYKQSRVGFEPSVPRKRRRSTEADRFSRSAIARLQLLREQKAAHGGSSRRCVPVGANVD